MLLSQGTGLALVALIVALRAEGAPDGEYLVYAAVSGVAGIAGLTAFYRGLAVGAMAVVAPISATAAGIPVVVGLATGDRPSAMQGVGLVLALVGVVLASREEVGDGGGVARGAGMAIVSALGFGFFFAAIDRASDADVLWAVFANRVTGVSILTAALLVLRPPIAAQRADLPRLALIGALDIGAKVMFAIASTRGLLSLVAVLGALYPITTVTLARVVLGERPHRVAQIGVVAALAGVVLIAAG